MKNLLVIFCAIAIGGVVYFNTSGSCAFADSPAKAAGGDAGASTISTEQQPNVPAGWVTDIDAALAQAKAEDKEVFIDFTGSDWCGWCIKLDKEILDTTAFQDYAKDNLIRVYIDFPRNKPQSEALQKQNEGLAEKYGVRGFPTIVVLSPEGKTLAKMGYQRGGPEPFIDALKELSAEAKES